MSEESGRESAGAGAHGSPVEWANWSGSVQCRPARIVRPQTEDDVVRMVRESGDAGRRIRVVGSGHSGTPLCETEGDLLALDALCGVESHDRAALRASIGAGTKLCDLGDPLLALGMAMENLGDIDKQALAGAVGTGTHGTGRRLGNLSTQVTGLRLVTAEGAVLDLDEGREGDAERLRACRVALGALGVMTSIRLRLLPAYRLHERIWRAPVDETLARLASNVADNRHFEFFWLPHNDLAECKSLNPTEAPVDDLPDRKYERIGWSAQIIASIREQKFFEMEYAVPAEAGPDCFRALRARMQEKHPGVLWPIEYRHVAPDDAYLSPAFERDTVTLSVHQDGGLPYREFFADVEPIFWSCGGRPHWGKIHGLRAPQLADLYPEWDRFHAVRRDLDPAGRFQNRHLQEIFGDG